MVGPGLRAAFICALCAMLALGAFPAAAQDIGYLGNNRLVFEIVSNNVSNSAKGKGLVEYEGGTEPESTWRAKFRFKNLRKNATYVVVIQGRFGERGSDDAEHYGELCSFETNKKGRGSCFWYFRGLARLDEAQLRLRSETGDPMMQATRGNGPGSIKTSPNRYSPGGEVPARKAPKNRKKHR